MKSLALSLQMPGLPCWFGGCSEHMNCFAYEYFESIDLCVSQALFEGNPFKTIPAPFKLFYQCMRSKPGYVVPNSVASNISAFCIAL